MKFNLRKLNTSAQLAVQADVHDTFKTALDRQIAERGDLAAIWSRYGRVLPTFYGSGHHWMAHPQRHADPFVAMSYVAGAWPEAHINSNLIQLPLFSAVDVAEKISTIAGLTENGLTFVVGLGWRPEEFLAAGTEVRKRVSRFEESLSICRALWAGDTVDHAGPNWVVKGRLGTPLRNPEDVAVVIGAQSQVAAKRAGRIGDGLYVSWIMSHDSYRMINDAFYEELNRHNRPAPKYWSMSKFISVDLDSAKAHSRLDRMENMFSWYASAPTLVGQDVEVSISRDEEALKRTIAGTPDEVVEKLLVHAREYPYTDLLLTWLAPGDDASENREHFDMLCERVVVPLAGKLGLAADGITLRV